jgi:ADP-ribose pyrophosphatase YjhB (NUDIX family)
VHSGEKLTDALEREIAEEVGISPLRWRGPIAIVARSRPAVR